MRVIKIPKIRTSMFNLNFGDHSIRFWSTTYMALYISFALVDYLSAPITYKTFWLIRACVLPYFFLALLSTYIDVVKPYRPLVNGVMVFMAPFSIILMIAKSNSAEWSMYTYFAGIVLSIFPVGFIMMNTKYAAVILSLLAICYFLIMGLALNFYNGDYPFFIMTSFFVISALIASYLSTHLLERNQTKILAQKGELEDLVMTKNRLISILAHDIRSPCMSIVGFSDLFIEGVDEYKMKDAKYFMETVNLSAHNLLSLLNNLLEWSRIQTKTHSLSPTVVKMDQLITTNIEMLKDAMMLKNIMIKKHLSMNDLEVVADQQMIDTVLRNLLSNAIKFSPQHGEIDIECWKSDNMAYVAIRDCGVGIGEKRIEKLFEVSSAKSTKGTNNETGSGLGLVLCHEFVEINKGEIWVKSKEGKGSTFTFSLPLKNAI